MSPRSIPNLNESKPPTILHSKRWIFGRRQAASIKVLISNLVLKCINFAPQLRKILPKPQRYWEIVLYRLYLYTHIIYIYTYIYRCVLYSNFIAQHSPSQFKHIIWFYSNFIGIYFFCIYLPHHKTTDSRSFPPLFTHVSRLGGWRRQPWRILWETPVMDTSIQMFGYLYGCRYHFFIEWFMDFIVVMMI